ncbi:HAD-IA family hydrolase [Aestuariivita sp.]|jgi:phosphoglycolate phosphatase|uniref:HAD-IA family hydrolase n=1 Tax=Aestuariivita sp. TaxID=1872407 RepID=UPI00216C156B|nr:HAD-IA family hydrolase [Aestuariivita sp.]MCE8006658.1 HAD-IA family hydrolase [Aestuariivita sp.]
MSGPLRLVLFDVDGTLVDSQGDIVMSMTAAFEGVGAPVPDRASILSIVGLSLPRAMAELAPRVEDAVRARMVELYKGSYMALRAAAGSAASSPLYPGARAVLDGLSDASGTLLGVATGKSRRGLDALIAGHGLEGLFVTQQTADHHPSKPHPAMIEEAMRETGVEPHQTVMIGDTEFDMEMARAAGVHALGVSWGYHARERLRQADRILDSMDALPDAIDEIWRIAG